MLIDDDEDQDELKDEEKIDRRTELADKALIAAVKTVVEIRRA
jgi:hypothetical protein